MKKLAKILIILVLSLICVLGINVIISDGTVFLYQFKGNDEVWFMVLAFCFYMINKALNIKEKRLTICSIVLSLILTIFQILGIAMSKYETLEILFQAWKETILKFVGLFIIYYSISVVLFNWISTKKEDLKNIEYKFFTANKKSLIMVAVIICICWLPYLLKHFPGIVAYDSIWQIGMITGDQEFNQHHPVIHTMLIKFFMVIGQGIFKSMNVTVALYSIFQMIFMAFVFSFTIYYMAKKHVSFYIRSFTLLYFALFPPFAMLSITMWKDVIFGGLMLLSIIAFIEMLSNSEKFFNNKELMITSGVLFVVTILFRNNAIYAFIPTIILLIIYLKNYRKNVSILMCSVIVCVFLINSFITNVLNIPAPEERDKFSLLLQQVVRTRIYEEENLSVEEKQAIDSFFEIDDFSQTYMTFLSDPIRDSVNTTYFNENKPEFFKLWIKLLFKYPQCYIDAFCCMTSGYWSPEVTRVSLADVIIPNEYGMEEKPIWNNKFVIMAECISKARDIPIIGMLFNTGTIIWILLIMFAYEIYKKRYGLSIAFGLVIFYWATVLLGPLNSELRYIFCLYTCLPILAAITFDNIYNINEIKKGDMLDKNNIESKNGQNSSFNTVLQ